MFNKIKYIFFILVSVLFLVLPANAQLNGTISQYSPKDIYKSCYKNKCGVYNNINQTIIPREYDNVFWDDSLNYARLVVVEKDGKYGILTLKNEILLPVEYDLIETASTKKTFILKKNDNYSIIYVSHNDNFGKDYTIEDFKIKTIVKEGVFDKIISSKTADGYIYVKNGKYGIFTLDEKNVSEGIPVKVEISEGKYDLITPASYQFFKFKSKASVQKQTKIHTKSKKRTKRNKTKNKAELIPKITSYNNETFLADSQIKTKLYYDKVIDKFYAKKAPYYIVQKKSKTGVIDENYNLLVPLEYDKIKLKIVFKENDFLLSADEKYIYINGKNKEIFNTTKEATDKILQLIKSDLADAHLYKEALKYQADIEKKAVFRSRTESKTG